MANCDIDGVLDMDCLVATDEAAFIATGVTDGEMLRGVKYFGKGSRTHSVAMDASTGPSGSSRRSTRPVRSRSGCAGTDGVEPGCDSAAGQEEQSDPHGASGVLHRGDSVVE
jgi:hypothetical protein